MHDDHHMTYFINKAQQCFRIAQNCSNEKVAFTIKQLGYEFVAEALNLGANPATLPRAWLNRKRHANLKN